MSNSSVINMDALSDGQVASKLWLCRELEKLFPPSDLRLGRIWIYGSWYGFLAFLFLSRERLSFQDIHLFDIDPAALKISEKVLDHWRISSSVNIHFHNHDCQTFNRTLPSPHLIINTSVEHFPNYQWWNEIPEGIYYAFQSTNMEHHEHISPVPDLNSFKASLGLKASPYFEGQHSFEYPGFRFDRFMLIGKK